MNKLKQRLLIYASGLLFMLTGCVQDNIFDNRPETDDKSLTFTFHIDGMTTSSATRAAISPIDGETSVESLHLLFFEASGDQSGTLIEMISLPGGAGTVGKLTMETSYVLPTGIDASKGYHIIGIANLDKYVENTADWLAHWAGATEAFFRDNASVEVSGTDDETDYDTYCPINYSELLMNGYVDKAAGLKNIQMVLTRNVARFDIQNTAATHALQSASVWNAYMHSSITGEAPFDYSSLESHTKRFYGINTEGDNVTGGLYAFANYSKSPGVNDKITTCLIVGLKKSPAESTRFYRININTAGGTQLLKDNYAYKITILSVTGDGYASENEAWEGTSNQLVYTVNNWDLDDNGMIVSDEHSILAIPVKTVKIGPTGGENSYSVTTFSTLENPEPLRVKSQLYDPDGGNITARISNGNLVIDARPMNTGEEKRSGIITISFAGLETIVNVLQTASGDVFLEVSLDDGWKEFLPPTANAMSDYIFVKASGPWTARLFGSKNFAFQNMLGDYVTQISSSDFTNNKFHVYTSTSNESKTDTEKGFVLISLDSDPTNYIAVVNVNQSSRGGIDTEPVNLEAIHFYGSRKLKTTAGNQTVSDTQYSFKVSSSGSITENNVRLAGANYDKFSFTYDKATGLITVWAKELNNTANTYTATLSVSDNRNGNLLVSLVQGNLEITLVAPTDKVDAMGGDSDPIEVIIEDANAEWKATLSTVTNGTRAIIHHNAKLMKADGTPLQEGEYTNQKLYVEFPKVYFPNRETEIKAIVTVTIDGLQPKKCEVYQEKLKAKDLKIWSRWSNGGAYTYGSLGNRNYFDGFIDRLNAKIPGGLSSVLTMGTNALRNIYPTNEHVWLQMSNSNAGSEQNTCWTHVNNIYNDPNFDGIAVFMMGEYNNNFSMLNSASSMGYTHDGNGSGTGNVKLNNDASVTNTRVYKFIIEKGHLEIKKPDQLTFYNDAVNSRLTSYPSSAVPILTYDATGRYNMVIDPKNKLVFMGDETYFASGYLDNTALGHANITDRSAFIDNLIDYMLLAAQYGSHFTDMLIDGASVAEPWSNVWGANAWPN